MRPPTVGCGELNMSMQGRTSSAALQAARRQRARQGRSLAVQLACFQVALPVPPPLSRMPAGHRHEGHAHAASLLACAVPSRAPAAACRRQHPPGHAAQHCIGQEEHEELVVQEAHAVEHPAAGGGRDPRGVIQGAGASAQCFIRGQERKTSQRAPRLPAMRTTHLDTAPATAPLPASATPGASHAVVVHAQHAAPRHAVVVRARRLPGGALPAVPRPRHRGLPPPAAPRLLLRRQPLPGLELEGCSLQVERGRGRAAGLDCTKAWLRGGAGGGNRVEAARARMRGRGRGQPACPSARPACTPGQRLTVLHKHPPPPPLRPGRGATLAARGRAAPGSRPGSSTGPGPPPRCTARSPAPPAPPPPGCGSAPPAPGHCDGMVGGGKSGGTRKASLKRLQKQC